MKTLITCFVLLSSIASCKTIARTAAKHWSKKQIKEFVNNCEEKSSKIVGTKNASKFCDCAVDQVAEKYKNYDDAKSVSITEIVKIANNCR